MRIVVFALNNPAYVEPAAAVLRDYFNKFNLPHSFVLAESYNPRKAHPSWLKLLSHKLVPGQEFILNWDLDLLPLKTAPDIRNFIDISRLNLAVDSSLLAGYPGFNPNFKYNGGLMGIPATMAAWAEAIYNECAPGTYPSYEQYYLNDRIVADQISVHRLPNEVNTLYPRNASGMELWRAAAFRHYTFGVMDASDKLVMVQEHHDAYFRT